MLVLFGLNAERAYLVCIDEGGAERGVDVHHRVVKAFLVGTLLCESELASLVCHIGSQEGPGW